MHLLRMLNIDMLLSAVYFWLKHGREIGQTLVVIDLACVPFNFLRVCKNIQLTHIKAGFGIALHSCIVKGCTPEWVCS